MKKPIYSPQDEQALMSRIWSPEIADDPYKFVLFVFPWGQEGTPLARFTGPRKWQRRFLRKIAEHIAQGKELDVAKLLRMARSSGRGIGKSALVAWLVLWFVSTRIGATAIISANTENQLRQITFAEIGKWTAMAIHSHWWEVVGIKVDPAKWLREVVERDLKKGCQYWGIDGKLWSSDNPDAYAGPHNHDGMMVVFDEGSGIDDAIWSVANGYFTEPTFNRFWFAFSQGRRNSGYFYDIFNSKRDFWESDQIDARDVEGTDPVVYQEIIDEHGEDSDEARVEVYGLFPSNDDENFISPSLVDKAVRRGIESDNTAPIVIGVDPSGGGSDWFVILVRQGRVILKIHRFKIEDNDEGTMLGVGHIAAAIDEFKPALTVVDSGLMGGPIADRLNEQKYKVRKVNFSWASTDGQRYGNKRAEMWAAMKKWLNTGCIPDDKRLRADLIAPRKKPDSKNVMFLESKKDIRKRRLPSPDSADALAVTFAFPVAHREGKMGGAVKRVSKGHKQAGPVTSWMGI